MRKIPAYPGKLGEPLEPLPEQTLLSYYFGEHSETREDLLAKSAREESEKLLLLLAHFGITETDPHRWLLLSLSLARAHVPGFQRCVRPGRKRAWDVITDAELKVDVEDLLRTNQKGVNWACSVLTKREPWKTKLGKAKKPAEILRQAYYRAEEGWVRAVRSVKQNQVSIAEQAVKKP